MELCIAEKWLNWTEYLIHLRISQSTESEIQRADKYHVAMKKSVLKLTSSKHLPNLKKVVK